MQISTKTAVRGLLAAGVVAIAALTLGGCPQPGGPTDEEKLATLKTNATNWAKSAIFSFTEVLIPDVLEIPVRMSYNGGEDIEKITEERWKKIEATIASLNLEDNVEILVVETLRKAIGETATDFTVTPPFTNTVSRATSATTDTQIALAEYAATRQVNGIV
jgi:hypothetical protein